MLKMTNNDVMEFITTGVAELLDSTKWESLDEWAETIDTWCEDYENGVFDSLKIEPNDIYFDEVLRSCYHKLIDKLDVVTDLMYEEWEQNHQC